MHWTTYWGLKWNTAKWIIWFTTSWSYLKSPGIPVYEAKNLFRFRNRTANFKENFGDKYPNKACPLCTVHMDTQTHAVQCDQIKQTISVEGSYSNIFKEKIPSDISKTLYKITKLREDLIWRKETASLIIWRP